MTHDIALACRCGAVQGKITNAPASLGPRTICMCDDCQAYARYLGHAEDVLDANGGTDIVPVRPAHLKITRGTEYLSCMQLTRKGMFRWYASCCRTPVANAMPSARVPYAGLFRMTLQDDVGPVRARVQARYGIGTIPEDAHETASLGVILRVLVFLVPGFIRRQHQPSPFFDARGQPTAEPHVLEAAERERLRALCGPNLG